MTEYEKYLNILSIVYYIFAAIIGLLSIFLVLQVATGLGIALGFPGYPAGTIIGGATFAGYNLLLLAIVWTFAWLLMSTAGKLRMREGHTFCVVIAALLCVAAPTMTMSPAGETNIRVLSAIPGSMVLGALTLLVLTREPVKHLFGVRLTPMPPRARDQTAPSPGSHSSNV